MELSLRINGVGHTFGQDGPSTLAQLLTRMKIDHTTVVAEIDGKIVPAGEFAATLLKAGSSIELVRFVGGG